jgi:hypothetical protein
MVQIDLPAVRHFRLPGRSRPKAVPTAYLWAYIKSAVLTKINERRFGHVAYMDHISVNGRQSEELQQKSW